MQMLVQTGWVSIPDSSDTNIYHLAFELSKIEDQLTGDDFILGENLDLTWAIPTMRYTSENPEWETGHIKIRVTP